MNKQDYYSNKEKPLLARIDAINAKIKNAWQAYKKSNPDAYGVKNNDTDTVLDGFYPNYTKQPVKILFIGRESYGLAGCDYIEVFIDHYLNGRTGPEGQQKNINRDKFHKMLIQVAYGIIHEKKWNDVPSAFEICENRRIFDSVSFAFINLSKLSNENTATGHRETDWNLVNTSLDMTINKENLILQEITTLDPDLIVCMNFERDRLCKVFGDNLKIFDNEWFRYHLNINGKEILLLDQSHFSATRGVNEQEIFDGISKEWKNFVMQSQKV